MKKAILKNLMILSIAFGGLFLVGNNVFAGVCDQDLDDPGDESGGGNCTSLTRCNQGFGDHGTHTGDILCCQTASFRGYARK